MDKRDGCSLFGEHHNPHSCSCKLCLSTARCAELTEENHKKENPE